MAFKFILFSFVLAFYSFAQYGPIPERVDWIKVHDNPSVWTVKNHLTPDELGVLVNVNCKQSRDVADYYVKKYKIPAENIVKLSIPADEENLDIKDFEKAKKQVDESLGEKVQGLVITWTKPFRVCRYDCEGNSKKVGMSVTSAFALGFDRNYFGHRLVDGWLSPYYDSDSVRPFTDFGIRPAMMLAGMNLDDVKALIDRSYGARLSFPKGKAFFVNTTDEKRSARWVSLETANRRLKDNSDINSKYVRNATGKEKNNEIKNEKGILFYFTGLPKLHKIESNTFVPGAIADHLTSFGGVIEEKPSWHWYYYQTRALRWLEAGASASYGTVVEPHPYPQKFPHAAILTERYFRGETALEAYWKSVHYPGEGLFIGDPLSRPFGTKITYHKDQDRLEIETTALKPYYSYVVERGDPIDGLERVEFENLVEGIELDHEHFDRTTFYVDDIDPTYMYRVLPKQAQLATNYTAHIPKKYYTAR